jgi:hypothetical protein
MTCCVRSGSLTKTSKRHMRTSAPGRRPRAAAHRQLHARIPRGARTFFLFYFLMFSSPPVFLRVVLFCVLCLFFCSSFRRAVPRGEGQPVDCALSSVLLFVCVCSAWFGFPSWRVAARNEARRGVARTTAEFSPATVFYCHEDTHRPHSFNHSACVCMHLPPVVTSRAASTHG